MPAVTALKKDLGERFEIEEGENEFTPPLRFLPTEVDFDVPFEIHSRGFLQSLYERSVNGKQTPPVFGFFNPKLLKMEDFGDALVPGETLRVAIVSVSGQEPIEVIDSLRKMGSIFPGIKGWLPYWIGNCDILSSGTYVALAPTQQCLVEG